MFLFYGDLFLVFLYVIIVLGRNNGLKFISSLFINQKFDVVGTYYFSLLCIVFSNVEKNYLKIEVKLLKVKS